MTVRQCLEEAGRLLQEEVDKVLDLAHTLWCERAGIGHFEIVIDRAKLGELEAMGLTPRVLVDNLQQQIDAERQQIIEHCARPHFRPLLREWMKIVGDDAPEDHLEKLEGWWADYDAACRSFPD